MSGVKSKAWHSMSVAEVVKELRTSPRAGLSVEEAKRRLNVYGPNEIVVKKRRGPLKMLLEQFANFLVVILLVATVISFALGEREDAIAILAIVVLMAFLGFAQEYRAEKSIEALKRLTAPKAKVLRGGQVAVVLARDLVPGDVVILEEGDRVPADLRLFEAIDLYVDESMLTGESVPVLKRADVVLPPDTPVAERVNMAFMGTYVTRGKGRGVVVSTGMATEMGKVARMIGEAEEEKTPLQKQLEVLGRQIGAVLLALTVVVFAAGVAHGGKPLEVFMTSVALAVAAIPEGLPAIVTLILSIGVWRLARRNAIIRRLSAVEALGAATVICTDKTGTLTKNEMTARLVALPDGRLIKVTGVGYNPSGELLVDGRRVRFDEDPGLRALMLCATLCNDAELRNVDGEWTAIGDPLEAALIVLALKSGLNVTKVRRDYKRVGEVPFNSKRKRMLTVNKNPNGGYLVLVKGAPEVVLNLCDYVMVSGRLERLSDGMRERVNRLVEDMASRALRVLAFAYKRLESPPPHAEDAEGNLIFLGLVGLMDPPREGVKEAIAKAKRAGIKVVMVTGDHAITAKAIAKEIGMDVDEGIVLTGRELDAMSDEELEEVIDRVVIFARVSPEHKARIVKAYKRRGHIVAMTGDGVNDAPALKLADIGIAMGRRGTDVAREAADMVLADDNFTTIVAAIEEGRVIYDNIRKPVRYLLSCNMGEVLSIFLAEMVNLGLLLKPLQILWMNLVTDALPAAGLGLEPPEPGVMERPPRNPKEPILTRRGLYYIVCIGVICAILTLAVFMLHSGLGVDYARTAAFMFLVTIQLYHALNCRSADLSLFKIGALTNPRLLVAILLSMGLQLAAIYAAPHIFEVVPMDVWHLALIVVLASSIVLIEECRKLLKVRTT